MAQIFEGGPRAAQSAVGESEQTIASNVAANWPSYNGQPLSEALGAWNSIVTRSNSEGTPLIPPVILQGSNKIFKEPWRNYSRFGAEKRDRIISLINEKIAYRIRVYGQGLAPRREEWHFKASGRDRVTEVVRDEKGHFVRGFPPSYVTDISGVEFF